MAALRDEQAEVQRGPGDPVGGVSRAPGPQLAGRRTQLDPDWLCRHRQPVRDIAEWPRADADMRDVPEPVRLRAPHSDGIGDVLAVRPGLHQPGG